jgi:hypothetical protein
LYLNSTYKDKALIILLAQIYEIRSTSLFHIDHSTMGAFKCKCFTVYYFFTIKKIEKITGSHILFLKQILDKGMYDKSYIIMLLFQFQRISYEVSEEIILVSYIMFIQHLYLRYTHSNICISLYI